MDAGLISVIIVGLVAWAIVAAIRHDNKLQIEAEEKERRDKEQSRLDAAADEQWPIIDRMEAAETPKAFFSALDELRKCRIKADLAVGRNSVIMVNEFLDRFWMDCKERRVFAFSPEERQHALNVFFESIELYKQHLYPENIDHLEAYRAEYEVLCGDKQKGDE